LTLEGPLISTASGPLAGFRNAIINGNFDIWQRGTSASAVADGAYLADRWQSSRVGSNANVSRQAFTLGQTDVPGEPSYFHRTVVTSSAGASNRYATVQLIEDVRTFAGQTVTVSFWAKADATKPISMELEQVFGTGGSPSSAVQALGVSKVNLSTAWQKVTKTVSLPSISGKTIGTDNNSNLRLNIWLDAGSDYNSRTDSLGQQSGTFDIAQVQIEIGSQATPFERRPIATELALCQRYYWKTFPLATAPAQNAGITGSFAFGVLAINTNCAYSGASFPVRMRIAPTLTGFNPSAANAQARNTTYSADFSSTTPYATEWGFSFTASSGNWGAAGSQSYLHLTAVAEL
jgi:hypothetical protein